MRKNILKKIGLISKSGFFASGLLNIGAMENEIHVNKTNIETDINNISSNNINNFNNFKNINNINNNVNNSEKKITDNLFLDNIRCKDIDEKIFFKIIININLYINYFPIIKFINLILKKNLQKVYFMI